jgi:transcriptional regulator GlxA family with amidase domain
MGFVHVNVFFLEGLGARPHLRPPGIIDFIRRQARSAKYILSVCTGSWLLADAGVLDGKRVTSNKFAFRSVKVSFPTDRLPASLSPTLRKRQALQLLGYPRLAGWWMGTFGPVAG